MDADQGGAFGAFLVDVAALEHAGEHDPAGVFGEMGAQMDVAERPVLVAVGDELLDGAGGVVLVHAVPAGGVEQADVELAGLRRRVVLGDVVLHGAVGEPLAVDDDVQAGHRDAVRGGGPEQLGALGPGQLAGEHGLRVMVAADGVHGNAGAGEAGELADEEVAGGVILPVTIEQIPGEQDEGDLF